MPPWTGGVELRGVHDGQRHRLTRNSGRARAGGAQRRRGTRRPDARRTGPTRTGARACARASTRTARRSGRLARSSSSAAAACRHAAFVSRRAVLDGGAADLAQHRQIARDDRRAARHRLDERQPESFAVGRLQHERRAAVDRRAACDRRRSPAPQSRPSTPSASTRSSCSRVNGPPTRTRRSAGALALQSDANTRSSRSIRLRGIVLPTCSSSIAPSGDATRRAAARSAVASGSLEYARADAHRRHDEPLAGRRGRARRSRRGSPRCRTSRRPPAAAPSGCGAPSRGTAPSAARDRGRGPSGTCRGRGTSPRPAPPARGARAASSCGRRRGRRRSGRRSRRPCAGNPTDDSRIDRR